MIVALVPDLMDRSRVSAALPDARFTRDANDCADATVVFVDLARHPDAVATVRAAAPTARIVAMACCSSFLRARPPTRSAQYRHPLPL